jgi:putative ABC transport system permease protein
MGVSGLALAFAVFLAATALPFFNRLAGSTLDLSSLTGWGPLIGFAGLAFFTGLIAGGYPAFFLSGFRPVAVLKGSWAGGSRRFPLRGFLVVLQFSISILLITATLIMMRQVNYIRTSHPGFDKERALVVRIRDADAGLREGIDSLKNVLVQNPGIAAASLSDGIPGIIRLNLTMDIRGRPAGLGFSPDVIIADYDFAGTYGIDIVEGRNFSREFGSDAQGAYLVNQTAVEEFALGPAPVDREISFGTGPDDWGKIVGVMKDFHFASFKEKIGPLVVWLNHDYLKIRGYYLTVKIGGGDISGMVDFVRSQWKTKSGGEFDYFFADENFDALYRNEVRVLRIIRIFSSLAVFLACLGIFGLASYTIERKTKEIGIRKVLGASIFSIFRLLTSEFAGWILIANLIAWPAAWYFMHRWLLGFAYRTALSPWAFLLSALAALSVSLLTVGYQTARAAAVNPNVSLRGLE